MKTYPLAIAVFALTFSLSALANPHPQCKSHPMTYPEGVTYVNRGLDEPGGVSYDLDCVAIFQYLLENSRLPEVDGQRVAARLEYDLRFGEVMDVLKVLLDSANVGHLMYELKFSLGEDDDPEAMTSITMTAWDETAAR